MDFKKKINCLHSTIRQGCQNDSLTKGEGFVQEAHVQGGRPSIPIKDLFLDGNFPRGEEVIYPNFQEGQRAEPGLGEGNLHPLEEDREEMYRNFRQAAEAHRQVRKYIKTFIRPGMKMIDICEHLEDTVRSLIGKEALNEGLAFPTGCSLNNCAAHYTPNPGDETVLGERDVCKIDFGTHVDGRIIDCAFTLAFDPVYDPLLQAAREGTYAGIRAAGIGARFGEIGEAIQEVIESFEVELDGEVLPLKPIANLCGHLIDQYKIHGGKMVPTIRDLLTELKMEEGEVYAIETFPTTGMGYVHCEGDCSHFMKNLDEKDVLSVNWQHSKNLLQAINKNFGTLAFCRRWLDRLGIHDHMNSLKDLCFRHLVNPYPPLSDIKGSYTSQFEHTIVLRPTCKEILSKGDDY